MRRAENNTGLATLQQELDKFNEDRQGNKEKKKKEKKKTRNQKSSSGGDIRGLIGDSVVMGNQHNGLHRNDSGQYHHHHHNILLRLVTFRNSCLKQD